MVRGTRFSTVDNLLEANKLNQKGAEWFREGLALHLSDFLTETEFEVKHANVAHKTKKGDFRKERCSCYKRVGTRRIQIVPVVPGFMTLLSPNANLDIDLTKCVD